MHHHPDGWAVRRPGAGTDGVTPASLQDGTGGWNTPEKAWDIVEAVHPVS